MEGTFDILLPFVLLLGRISAFVAVLPLFSWQVLPLRIRAAMALLITIFFAIILPPPQIASGGHWLNGIALMIREIFCGLALGMATRLTFLAVQQAGRIAGRQMGFALASVIDPMTGEQGQPVGTLFEIAFAVFFLAAGGHHLLLRLIAHSYVLFPAGTGLSTAIMAEGVVQAGSAMLLFALKLAGPLLAAFLILSVVLAVLARVLPEMNILLMSLPLRVGLGFVMAAALMPSVNWFATELARWMSESILPQA